MHQNTLPETSHAVNDQIRHSTNKLLKPIIHSYLRSKYNMFKIEQRKLLGNS